jgi:hypothetical protein
LLPSFALCCACPTTFLCCNRHFKVQGILHARHYLLWHSLELLVGDARYTHVYTVSVVWPWRILCTANTISPTQMCWISVSKHFSQIWKWKLNLLSQLNVIRDAFTRTIWVQVFASTVWSITFSIWKSVHRSGVTCSEHLSRLRSVSSAPFSIFLIDWHVRNRDLTGIVRTSLTSLWQLDAHTTRSCTFVTNWGFTILHAMSVQILFRKLDQICKPCLSNDKVQNYI